jgi:Zn-dependent protease with chaperone function
MWEYREPLAEFTAAALSTHPPTQDRIETLRELQADLAAA